MSHRKFTTPVLLGTLDPFLQTVSGSSGWPVKLSRVSFFVVKAGSPKITTGSRSTAREMKVSELASGVPFASKHPKLGSVATDKLLNVIIFINPLCTGDIMELLKGRLLY